MACAFSAISLSFARFSVDFSRPLIAMIHCRPLLLAGLLVLNTVFCSEILAGGHAKHCPPGECRAGAAHDSSVPFVVSRPQPEYAPAESYAGSSVSSWSASYRPLVIREKHFTIFLPELDPRDQHDVRVYFDDDEVPAQPSPATDAYGVTTTATFPPGRYKLKVQYAEPGTAGSVWKWTKTRNVEYRPTRVRDLAPLLQ